MSLGHAWPTNRIFNKHDVSMFRPCKPTNRIFNKHDVSFIRPCNRIFNKHDVSMSLGHAWPTRP